MKTISRVSTMNRARVGASLRTALIAHWRVVVVLLTPFLAGIVTWLTSLVAAQQSFQVVSYGFPFAWKIVTTKFLCTYGRDIASFCVPVGVSVGYSWISFIGDIGFYAGIGYGIALLRHPYMSRHLLVLFEKRVAEFTRPTWGRMNLALRLSTGLGLLSGIWFLVGTGYAPIASIIIQFEGLTFNFVCTLISCAGAIVLLLQPMKIETQGIAGFITFLTSLPTISLVFLFVSSVLGLVRVA